MATKAVLFDLDGTLLPLEQEIFTKTYIGLFVKKMAKYGYSPEKFLSVLMKSLEITVINDGNKTNEALIRELFISELGEGIIDLIPVMNEFYEKDFESVRAVCGCDPKASRLISSSKGRYKLALATMPVFPETATRARVRWAGLDWNDFELVTTYENSSYCKPNPDYYRDVAEKLGVSPSECLMVGNDTLDDMSAERVGMKVFLLTDHLYNRDGTDIDRYAHGGFDDLMKFIECL
jgi:FMN phosphatase YigB (HAD superfamily)